MIPMTRRALLIALQFCTGIGPKKRQLIGQWLLQQADEVLAPSDIERLLHTSGLTTAQVTTTMTTLGAAKTATMIAANLKHTRCVTLVDATYPYRLKETYNPPLVLFYLGDLQLIDRPALAVVGSRQPTDYAVKAIKQVLPAPIAANIPIISGLARGVDTLSHQAALAYGGRTIAVVGTGLGHVYPAENRELMTTIARDHLIVSEYPWATPGAPFRFPERNRIIAGLCQSLLVVEAKHHSGSLITANLALQENRNVLAIPGRIDAPNSVGCNELILAGATPILNGNNIVEEF